ncbi:MAG TPA: bifunctional glycosyltransferase family 2/GtrA family protein [Candidatus Aphodomonas merdavium]|nr:bifunctional glycosyltransferase family 2/GtrA family protein [Candidatus Aphodomonas merdavium]
MDDTVIAVIPAYKPQETMLPLCRALREAGMPVVVVDDGGGEGYRALFEAVQAMGCTLVRHAVNLGKGRALKTGINEALTRHPDLAGVVTADADGQHTVKDILRVREALLAHPSALTIGARAFVGDVPFRSRFGNGVTRAVYRFVAGQRCTDTQTGLRGIPARALPALLRLPGERYEYEMEMLLRLRSLGLSLHEVRIDTIYENNNEGSHFNALRDSARIYAVILRFALSSIVSFCVDYSLYLLLLLGLRFPGALSYALARVVSSLVNYTLNSLVFHGARKRGTLVRYYLLAACQLAMGAFLVHLLGLAGLGESWVKFPVDIALFFISYMIQRDYVFGDNLARKNDR